MWELIRPCVRVVFFVCLQNRYICYSPLQQCTISTDIQNSPLVWSLVNDSLRTAQFSLYLHSENFGCFRSEPQIFFSLSSYISLKFTIPFVFVFTQPHLGVTVIWPGSSRTTCPLSQVTDVSLTPPLPQRWQSQKATTNRGAIFCKNL